MICFFKVLMILSFSLSIPVFAMEQSEEPTRAPRKTYPPLHMMIMRCSDETSFYQAAYDAIAANVPFLLRPMGSADPIGDLRNMLVGLAKKDQLETALRSRDFEENTPLHCAVDVLSAGAVDALLKYRPDLLASNDGGLTPLDLAHDKVEALRVSRAHGEGHKCPLCSSAAHILSALETYRDELFREGKS